MEFWFFHRDNSLAHRMHIMQQFIENSGLKLAFSVSFCAAEISLLTTILSFPCIKN